MITLLLSIAILILGFLFYGTLVEKVFGVNPGLKMPVISRADGVDYVRVEQWKLFFVQFLNIAGFGPVFGTIMGVMYGPSCFIWIIFGCLFGGAVHDYLTGMISVRSGGLTMPELAGIELGKVFKPIFYVLIMLLMVFMTVIILQVSGELLQSLVAFPSAKIASVERPVIWMAILMIYFIVASLFPLDTVIGHVYPYLAAIMIVMALGLIVVMMWMHGMEMPEIFTPGNFHPEGYRIFPMMFTTVACGAVSGFHSSQTPIVARCMESELNGRPIFYGAMIAEGVLALIWASAAGTVFADVVNGVNGYAGMQAFAHEHPEISIAPYVIQTICSSWFGSVAGLAIIIGVIVAPITTGDTTLRGARIMIADALNLSQHELENRLLCSIPVFLVVIVLSIFNIGPIWSCLSWIGPVLAAMSLWMCTVHLYRRERKHGSPTRKYKEGYLVALVPACFMTMVSVCDIFLSPDFLGWQGTPFEWAGYLSGLLVTVLCLCAFSSKASSMRKMAVHHQ